MLQRPGVPSQSWTADSTPETLTPPALSKEVSQDAEIPLAATDDTILLSPDADEEGYNGDGDAYTVDGDDDSDSDEGLTMTRRRPKSKSVSGPIEPRASVRRLERRDTNNSVGSAETAKKMVLEG
jgi:[calcium/calmodulin-dependent protein kinase] kinase